MKAISIMYHDIVAGGDWDASGFPGADAALYKLTRDDFAAHLEAIARATGAKPSSVLELASALEPAARASKSFMLTFDDGGVSAHTHAARMLDERGWRGHFFVTTDFIGTHAFLNVEQIRDLRKRGHVIGSHSSSHPQRMARCTREEMLREWETSVGKLSDVLGEAVTVASVPGGYYSVDVARAAAEAGIKMLFTSEPTARCGTVDGCLVLGRYAVQRATRPRTAAAMAAGKLAPRLAQKLLWDAKKIAKALGGEYYLKARQSFIGSGG